MPVNTTMMALSKSATMVIPNGAAQSPMCITTKPCSRVSCNKAMLTNKSAPVARIATQRCKLTERQLTMDKAAASRGINMGMTTK